MPSAGRERVDAAFGLETQRVHPVVRSRSHRHSEIELNYVDEGGLVYLFGGQQAALRGGSFAVFWGALPHRIVALEPATLLYWLTVPLDDFIAWSLPEAFTAQVLSGEFLVDPQPAPAPADRLLFETWHADLFHASAERRKALHLELEARLRRAAAALQARPAAPGPLPPAEVGLTGLPYAASPGYSQARRMARYITENYTRLITVRQVAEQIGLHPNYAMNIFKRYYQMSILDYLTSYRVAHAQRLLLISGKPVEEIAAEAGFGSLSSFYAVFKKECGVSPKKYRAMLGKA